MPPKPGAVGARARSPPIPGWSRGPKAAVPAPACRGGHVPPGRRGRGLSPPDSHRLCSLRSGTSLLPFRAGEDIRGSHPRRNSPRTNHRDALAWVRVARRSRVELQDVHRRIGRRRSRSHDHRPGPTVSVSKAQSPACPDRHKTRSGRATGIPDETVLGTSLEADTYTRALGSPGCRIVELTSTRTATGAAGGEAQARVDEANRGALWG